MACPQLYGSAVLLDQRHDGGATPIPAMHRGLLALPLRHREDQSRAKLSPAEDRQALLSFLQDRLFSKSQGQLVLLSVPDFKVGTLDSLVSASEDFQKLEQTIEAIINRLHGHLQGLGSLYPDVQPIAVHVEDMDIEDYLQSFEWNTLKYRLDVSVKEIGTRLGEEATQMDNLIKAKMNAFTQSKGKLDSIQKSQSGSLLVRNLSSLIQPEDIVSHSEFLETLLVITPRQQKDQFVKEYTGYAEMIVPDALKLVAEDDESTLFLVTLFKRSHDAFRKACQERRITVRDYTPGAGIQETEVKGLEANLHAQWSSLIRLVASNLGEIHSLYIHLQVLRLFVESVLRYGLPAQYLYAYTRLPDEKASKSFGKKMLTTLDSLRLPGISLVELSAAMHLTEESVGGPEEQELWAALNMSSTRDYDPYVSLTLKLKL